MINTTADQIVFSFSKSKLDSAIRECLRKTVDGLIEFYGLSEVDLKDISTKFCKEGLYSKLVRFYALSNYDHVFDEDYVQSAFLLYQLRAIDDHKQLAYKFLTVDETAVEFREGYVRGLTRGIGVFLIALHCRGAITLPVAFNWPRPRKDGKKRVDIGKPFASELIAFIRTLEPQSQELNDPAFAAVVLLKSRREHLSSMGTKLLLATGWHSKEDVNLDELVQVRTAHGSIKSEYNAPLPCTAIVDILSRKYGDSINLTPQLYRETLKTRGHAKFRQALGDWDSPEITDTFLNAERARRVRNGKYPKEVWIRVQARSGQASNAARQCSCHGSAGPGRARERAAALDQGVRLRACRQSL